MRRVCIGAQAEAYATEHQRREQRRRDACQELARVWVIARGRGPACRMVDMVASAR